MVAIRITLRIQESKVRNPDPPDRRRFVLSEHSFLVFSSFLPRPLFSACANDQFIAGFIGLYLICVIPVLASESGLYSL